MTAIDTHSRAAFTASAEVRFRVADYPAGYLDLTDWLTTAVARYLNVPADTIGIDTPLAEYGLDSVASLGLCADLEHEKGIVVETTIVWDYPTIDAIATHLAEQGASS